MLSPTPAPGLSDDQKKEQELKNLNNIKTSFQSATEDIRYMMSSVDEQKDAMYKPKNTFADSVTGRKLVELQKKLMDEVRDRVDYREVKRSASEPLAVKEVRNVYENLNAELKTHFDNWVAGGEFDFKARDALIDARSKELETKLAALAEDVRANQLATRIDEIKKADEELPERLDAIYQRNFARDSAGRLTKGELKHDREKLKNKQEELKLLTEGKNDEDIDKDAVSIVTADITKLKADIIQTENDIRALDQKGDDAITKLEELDKQLADDIQKTEKAYQKRAQEIEALADTKRKELEDFKAAEHLKSELNYQKTTLDAQSQQCRSSVRRRKMYPNGIADEWLKLDEDADPSHQGARVGLLRPLQPGEEGVFQRPGKPRVHLDKDGNCHTIPQDHDETMAFLSQKMGARGVKITFPSADLVNPVKVKELYDKAHEHNMHVNLKPLLDMMDAALKNDPSNWEYQKLRNQIQDLIILDKQWRKARSGEAEQKYADFATQARLDHRIRELEAANKNNLENKFPDLKGDKDAQDEKYVKTLLAGTTTELEKLKRLEHEAALLSSRAKLLEDAQNEAKTQLDKLNVELKDPDLDKTDVKFKKCEDAFVKLEEESNLQLEEIKRQGRLIEEQLNELKFDKKTEKGFIARKGAVLKVLEVELVPKVNDVTAQIADRNAERKDYHDEREQADRDYRVAHR